MPKNRYEDMSALSLSHVRYEHLTDTTTITDLGSVAKQRLKEINTVEAQTLIINWEFVRQRLNTIIQWCDTHALHKQKT
jgi:hypothetical protein